MISFANFFNRGKPKDTQQSVDAPKKQDFTGVMQAVVEEIIMASAYWLIGLVNSSLENKAASSHVEEQIIEKPMTAIEELVPKVIGLIDQLHDRTQSIIALENRLCTVETSLKEDVVSEQSAQAPSELISNLEKRFIEVKQLAKDLEGLTEALQHSSQTTMALENRVAHLEKLLTEYSVVPKLLKQNCQTIATLQQRLLLLEVSQGKNHHPIAK